MPSIDIPFFDTRETAKLELAANLLTYPFKFCRKEQNRLLLLNSTPANSGLAHIVHCLANAQDRLAAHLPLNGIRAIWTQRKRNADLLGIKTEMSARRGSSAHETESLMNFQLNIQILESVLSQSTIETGVAPSTETLRLAAACVWLSEHLAMIVIGIASAQVDHNTHQTVIAPASEEKQRHLRRVWFGSAFEKLSLQSASATINAYTHIKMFPNHNHGNPQELFANSLSLFPQHWRLPLERGPVAEILHQHLMPLLQLLTNTIAAHNAPGGPYTITRNHAKQLNIVEIYDFVFESEKNMHMVDRLFDTSNSGLVLGSRTPVSGLLKIAEELASKKFDKDWRSKVSPHQQSYVFERIKNNPRVDYFDFDARQHDVSPKNEIRLDVDFFVRDKIHSKLYAVQLKHLASTNKNGLLYWISRFRKRDSKLGEGVQQLENLAELVSTNIPLAQKLADNGIRASEIDNLVPVLLHNIGPLDFWQLQNGILLYDILTFCNVLEGRSATRISSANGRIHNGALEGSPNNGPSLHDPDSVIASYLADDRFRELRSFDLAGRTTRILQLGEDRFISRALGI